MSNTTTECDLLVIGSGASGLAAAVRGAWRGLRVQVIEKEAVFGGTSAWSGGWLWIPRNPLARAAGIDEPYELPKTYLRHELGSYFDEARVDAFLSAGPEMVQFFHDHTALQFLPGNAIPDFHGHTPAAGTGGRSVTAAPFDGRELGARVKQLRRPLKEISFWGMGIASGQDLAHFLKFLRNLPSTLYVTRRVLRHLRDLLLHGRGMHLVNGNALVARLAKSADDLGVQIRVNTRTQALNRDACGRINGVRVQLADGSIEQIHVRAGVVLACGGFPHDPQRISQLLPEAPNGTEHCSAAPKTNTGDGLRLGESIGGVINAELAAPAAYAPVSKVRRADGEIAHFPHLMERAKPGVIAVLSNGQRFCDEADSYHDYTRAQIAATQAERANGQASVSWLICDHRFLRRYGLGNVKPFPLPIAGQLRSGYLKRGRTPAELAKACGIDPAGLEQTLAEYNAHARRGEDPAFQRGGTPYNRIQGDAEVTPNPCVRPIDQAPYYAVQIHNGSLGTFAGLKTNAQAQVLDSQDAPIAGLYAVGTDAASVMGGQYPAGGINLGPGMTFGFIAANHIADTCTHPNSTQEHAHATL